jgi:hypothetical protein
MAEMYTMAGSKTKTPYTGAAQEIKKPHVKARIAQIMKDKYGIEPEPEVVKTEQEEAEENLKKWSTQSSQGANNYALYLLKKKEAGIIEKTVRKVLLSSFLPEDELDALEQAINGEIVLAGTNKSNNKGESAETPENIEEKA